MVHNMWQPDAFVKVHAHDNVLHLISHVLGISISLPSGLQLDVFGIYMPAKGTIRRMIYNHLEKQANGPHAIMMGDWNAAPHRAQATSADIAYKRFLLTHMQFDVPQDSRPSFLPAQADQLPSRLDDILLSKELCRNSHHVDLLAHTGSSDHCPLLMRLRHPDLIILPEVEPTPAFQAKLVAPQPKEALASFKHMATSSLASDLSALQAVSAGHL